MPRRKDKARQAPTVTRLDDVREAVREAERRRLERQTRDRRYLAGGRWRR